MDFPHFRPVIEDKVDWVAYTLALYEVYWVTPGVSSESEVFVLMAEFQKNLDAFVQPRRLYHTVDLALLSTPLRYLSRIDQLRLRNALLVASFSHASVMRCPPTYVYNGIDVTKYGALTAPYNSAPSSEGQDEIYI